MYGYLIDLILTSSSILFVFINPDRVVVCIFSIYRYQTGISMQVGVMGEH